MSLQIEYLLSLAATGDNSAERKLIALGHTPTIRRVVEKAARTRQPIRIVYRGEDI